MDEPVKKKYNIVFTVLLLIVLSAVYIWLSVVYFSDYINKKDIIKVHIGQFFILSVPLLLYFASGSIMIFLNKEKFLKKHNFFRSQIIINQYLWCQSHRLSGDVRRGRLPRKCSRNPELRVS